MYWHLFIGNNSLHIFDMKNAIVKKGNPSADLHTHKKCDVIKLEGTNAQINFYCKSHIHTDLWTGVQVHSAHVNNKYDENGETKWEQTM